VNPDRSNTAGPSARFVHDTAALTVLTPAEQAGAVRAARAHAFRATDYYLSLIDWSDPDDPIRRIIVPHADELAPWGELDPSAEAAVTVAPGVQHKYTHTALLLCNELCGGHCRYCFRKRIFQADNEEIAADPEPGLQYIAAHPEVTNVLLTGGDPLLLSTARLAPLLERLAAIPHVRVIRIGTKMPAFDPYRITGDELLLEAIRRTCTPRRRVYVIAHFDHPRELTDAAVAAIDRLLRAGAICSNQTPVIRGVNDDPHVLRELFRELSFIGCPAYYVFQCRPTVGNRPFAIPIVAAFRCFDEARRDISGVARRARFVLSHASGKVEVLAVDEDHIYARYHRARDPQLDGRFLKYHRNDAAFWLDDLVPA
jgi:KamA family protein